MMYGFTFSNFTPVLFSRPEWRRAPRGTWHDACHRRFPVRRRRDARVGDDNRGGREPEDGLDMEN